MSTFDRYIIRQALGPLVFFVLVLTGVVWLTQSLRIIDIVVNNNQGARVFVEFSLLLLPTVFSIVLQLGALAATVYTLHRLITDSELAAAFASGFSKLALTRPIAILGLGLMAMLAVDTLYLMPTAARVMRDRLAEVRGDLAAGLIRDGRFMTPAKNLTVYIREITPEGEMRGLLVQDSSDPQRGTVTYIAKRGVLTESENGPALVMFDGQAQQVEDSAQRLSLLRFDRLAYNLASFMEDGGVRARKPSERYFHELINPPDRDQMSPRAYGKMIAEGHEQLSAPLYGLALPLLAAAVMLGAGFDRRGAAGAVATALLLGAAARVAGLGAKSMLTSAPELWPLLYAIPILAIMGSILYLARAQLSEAVRGGATADLGGGRGRAGAALPGRPGAQMRRGAR
ncbi:MAG: LPS export ABC transporter permease LptF [Pseudomonadota bacterium]